MSKRMSKHTSEERIAAVLSVIGVKKSVRTIAKEYGVSHTTIKS